MITDRDKFIGIVDAIGEGFSFLFLMYFVFMVGRSLGLTLWLSIIGGIICGGIAIRIYTITDILKDMEEKANED